MSAHPVTSALPGRAARRVDPNLQVLPQPLLGGGRLVRDYLAGDGALAPFFAGHFGDSDAYRRKATEVAGRLDAGQRARMAPAIEPLGDAASRLSAILAGDGFFVTTGQQPALFGGPLYSLYKGLAAIRLADQLELELGRPVLALFWVGADDHDWDEANHAVLLDAQNYVRRISVAAPTNAVPLPLSERRWGADVTRAVADFSALLPRTEFSDPILEHLRTAYTADATVASSFTATLRLLLGDRRIALISSAAGEVRRAAAPVLRADIERSADMAAILARQTDRLEAAGYRAQVTVADGASNVMLLDEHGRDRLMRSGGGWLTRREKRPLQDAELLDLLGSEPERFSPNVLLRPVVENAILPTIAYVAGPGEIGYYAQIGCLYRAHGMLPPVVVPRPSVSLVEARVRKVLERTGLEPTQFRRPFHELATDVIRQEMPVEVEQSLAALRAALYERYEELTRAAAAIDPTLAGPLTTARNTSLVAAAETEKKIASHLRQKNEVIIEQLRKAAASLYPDGAAQERVLSPLAFIARYGTGLVAALEDALDMTPVRVASWAGPDCD